MRRSLMNAQAITYKYQNPDDPAPRGPQRPNNGSNDGNQSGGSPNGVEVPSSSVWLRS